jgi:hypothetical protein
MWLKVHNTEQDFLMFKYMINIIWYGSFRITSCINPRPISSLELKLSGWYWCLGLIRDVIRKEPYNILYLYKSLVLWINNSILTRIYQYLHTNKQTNWKKIREMLLTTLEHNQHDVIDVIWRLPVWNVKIRRYLASCTLEVWYNLTKISIQGKLFNYFRVFVVDDIGVLGWYRMWYGKSHIIFSIYINPWYYESIILFLLEFINTS